MTERTDESIKKTPFPCIKLENKKNRNKNNPLNRLNCKFQFIF